MNSITIFNSNNSTDSWCVVDDAVMGGKSSGQFNIEDNGSIVFKGKVSLENNGGFSLIRHRFKKINISAFKFIKLYLKGDDKKYQFRVKSKVLDEHAYKTSFNTGTNWEVVTILIKDLKPHRRGRKLLMESHLQEIEEVGFLIANTKEEFFKLEISKIELIKG